MGPEENIQSARVVVYLPLNATKKYTNQQKEYMQVLLTSVFMNEWPNMDDCLNNAIDTASNKRDNALKKSVKVTKSQTTSGGALKTTLYVRLLENEQGFVMGLVIGDWLDNIMYDPANNTWQP